MGSRIITLQRQARELGRLRTGYTDYTGAKPRPVRSSTWIVTSHAEHYVQAAADVWGGTPEQWQPLGNGAAQWRAVTDAPSLDAILPPGDPMSQAYEIWSKGGAQRRCDGMTEALADQPCFCRAKWGDNFHEIAPRDAACKVTTRLNVILPEMPDIGAWRVETHSFYSANEMAAAVDVLKGSIGMERLIPVRLRIEQRTRVAQGKTKQFPVVAVELRGGTAGQVLAGAVSAPAVGAGESRSAIEAPRVDYVELIGAAASREQVVKIWEQAKQDTSADGKAVEAAATARVAKLKQPDPAPPAPPAAETGTGDEAQSVPAATDAEMLWQAIVARWPRGMSELAKTFQGGMGVQHQGATESELAAFLKILTGGKYDDKVPAATSADDDKIPF